MLKATSVVDARMRTSGLLTAPRSPSLPPPMIHMSTFQNVGTILNNVGMVWRASSQHSEIWGRIWTGFWMGFKVCCSRVVLISGLGVDLGCMRLVWYRPVYTRLTWLWTLVKNAMWAFSIFNKTYSGRLSHHRDQLFPAQRQSHSECVHTWSSPIWVLSQFNSIRWTCESSPNAVLIQSKCSPSPLTWTHRLKCTHKDGNVC